MDGRSALRLLLCGLLGLWGTMALRAQAAVISLQGGFVSPFADMKSREVTVSSPAPGTRTDAFGNGFFLQASFWPGGAQRFRARGTVGICGMNGTSTGLQHLDLQYLAYGLSGGIQSSLEIQPRNHGLYAFSEVRLDWEFYRAKSPGSGWASFGAGSRSGLRLGVGVGLGWIAPGSGLAFEVEARASLSGPIRNSDSQGSSVFWGSLPPDRYLRLGVGWTWGTY